MNINQAIEDLKEMGKKTKLTPRESKMLSISLELGQEANIALNEFHKLIQQYKEMQRSAQVFLDERNQADEEVERLTEIVERLQEKLHATA